MSRMRRNPPGVDPKLLIKDAARHLSAVGYNLRLVLAWLRTILRVVLLALFQTSAIRLALKPAC